MMQPTLQRCKTASAAAYVECGSGAPLVLLHGVGMRAEAWQPQINALATVARVIALDLPGHGQTPPLAEATDLCAFVAWFARVAQELKLEHLNLVGHSMGALIAAGYAIEHPARVERLALLNAVYRRDAVAQAAVQARVAEIRQGRFDYQIPLARWFAPHEQASAACQTVRHLLQTVNADDYAAAYHAFAHGDACYADDWHRINCPVLLLTGSEDANSTPQMAHAMAAAASQGRAVVLEGQRHMLNLTAPKAVNALLREWLLTDTQGAMS